MTLVPLNLPMQSNAARYLADGSARLVNGYVENTDKDAKSPLTIYPNAGLDVWNTVEASGTASGATGMRAMLATDSYLYVVAGRKVTAIDTLGVKTVVTTLSGDGDVYMAQNRRSPTPEVCLVADGVGRIITGTSIATITDPDLPPPVSVSVIDGYFLFPTTFDRVFISGEDNGTAIAPLDFGKAQKQPDNTIYALGGERDAMIFGTRTVEWWTNSPDGSGNFPFVPIANIDIGCLGEKTVVQLNRAVAWIANDGTVNLREGYSNKTISTHYIERKIATASSTNSIRGFGWTETDTGHAFLAWTCAEWTIVYNMRNGLWHERKSFGRSNWRGVCAVQWQGMTLVGDYDDGRIYQVKSSVHTEGGEPIPMEVICPVAHMAPYAMRVNGIFLDMVTGTGSGILDEDLNPVVTVWTSNDGGHTWGPSRDIPLGVGGDVLRRLKTYRLGMFGPQGCTVRIACSSSVKRSLSGAYLDADRLTL